MKKFAAIILLAATLIPAAGAEAGEAEALSRFREANALYAAQDFGGAARLYRQLVEEGWKSAPLYFNLANACFKEGDLGRAILNYRKARNLSPGDPEINKNLHYARDSIRDDLAALRPGFYSRIKRSVVRFFPLRTWFILSTVLYTLTVIWVIFSLLIRPLSKFLTPVLKGLLPLVIISAVITALAYGYYRAPRGIILSSEVTARYGPAEEDAAAFQLHEGSEVRIARRENGWIQVILPDGKTGWIPSDSLGRI